LSNFEGISRDEQVRGPPMTLGDVRWLDAYSVMTVCKTCANEDVFNIEALPDSVPLSWFATRFVCKCCNAIGAYVFPHWTDRLRAQTAELERSSLPNRA
jgi:hypothetical protein